MSGDILNELKKHTIKGRNKVNGRHRWCQTCDVIDEIERLRAAVVILFGGDDIEGETIFPSQPFDLPADENTRLRAAGDQLLALVTLFTNPDTDAIAGAAVAAWKEARREQ